MWKEANKKSRGDPSSLQHSGDQLILKLGLQYEVKWETQSLLQHLLSVQDLVGRSEPSPHWEVGGSRVHGSWDQRVYRDLHS